MFWQSVLLDNRASRGVVMRTLSYVEKDAEKNVLRLLKLLRMFAIFDYHKQYIDRAIETYRERPVYRAYINNLVTKAHTNVRKHLFFNTLVRATLIGAPKQYKLAGDLGFNVPIAILVDPTSACNLTCEGCWAGKYSQKNALTLERLDRLCIEAKELGIYWITFSGGEPLLYPHLFDLMAKHNDMVFTAYTNGTLIDEKMADKIIEVGNFSPHISMEGGREQTDERRGEGTFDKIMHAMELLRERGAVFGVSLTVTRHNVDEVVSDAFIDFLIDKGVTYGWMFHYLPIGRNPNIDMMITTEQRAYLAERISHIRQHKPIMIADFWNDGKFTGGCIAAGRRYFHITAAGDVQPCAFVHFTTDNINEKSVMEVLASPHFRAYKQRQPFNENHLRPCPIVDCPSALREIVTETDARPTEDGAQAIFEEAMAARLDRRAGEWGTVADEILAKHCNSNT